MHISVLLNHRAKSCWQGQSSINVIFDEFTEKAKDGNKKKFGLQKKKNSLLQLLQFYLESFNRLKNFLKINKMLSILNCFVLSEFIFLLCAERFPYQKPVKHTTLYGHWLPSCVSLRYSYDISLPSSNQCASSEQTQKHLPKAHSDQGPTQSISQMAGPGISSDHKERWYGIFKTSAF